MKKTSVHVKEILLCILLVLFIVNHLTRKERNTALHMTSSYIAKKDIYPRSCIQESDIEEIQIPDSYLNQNVVRDKKDILGKYTDIQGKIPAGSFFYDSMLFDVEELPDYPSTQLYADQSIFQCLLDTTTLGHLTKSQRIDLSATIQLDEKQITETILYHARILMIQDYNGKDVTSPQSTTIPYSILLAVNTSDIEELNQLKTIATFQANISSETYINAEAQSNINSEIHNYLSQN